MGFIVTNQDVDREVQSALDARAKRLGVRRLDGAFSTEWSCVVAERVEKTFPIENRKSEIGNLHGVCGKLLASKLLRPLSVGTSIVTLNASAPILAASLAKIDNSESARITQLIAKLHPKSQIENRKSKIL